MSDEKKYLEIETKYEANDADRLKFKALARTLNPIDFVYVESRDVYYVKSKDEFLRYRMPAEHLKDPRAELTFKKKHVDGNNWVRTEVNLRVDFNTPELLAAFCEGLGYKRNFSVYKMCDIYYFKGANIVFYSVYDDFGKMASFIEIEASEDIGLTQDQAWEIVQQYEKILAPMGISHQKRKKLSLFEMYRRDL